MAAGFGSIRVSPSGAGASFRRGRKTWRTARACRACVGLTAEGSQGRARSWPVRPCEVLLGFVRPTHEAVWPVICLAPRRKKLITNPASVNCRCWWDVGEGEQHVFIRLDGIFMGSSYFECHAELVHFFGLSFLITSASGFECQSFPVSLPQRLGGGRIHLKARLQKSECKRWCGQQPVTVMGDIW